MTIAAIAGFVVWLMSGDVLMAASVVTLGVIWALLKTHEGPPVLALAMSFQWVSVTIGLFYGALTGRELIAITTDYRPMIAIGLGCIVAMTAGLYAGRWIVDRRGPTTDPRPEYAFTMSALFACYFVSVAVFGAAIKAAWLFPSITQAIIALAFIRLGFLYLVFRRLVSAGQWLAVGAILALEIVLGISGFYAGFREPLMMAALAVLEIFDRRRVRHWVTLVALGAAACALGVIWMGVRVDYRERFVTDPRFAESRSARIDSINEAARRLLSQDSYEIERSVDQLVERLWVIYYPALAVARVPAVLPHTDGQLMWATLQHVFMPRIFFPDKPDIGSDSDMVRKYSGVFVAGEDENTNIAFGYAAESYIDFGIPVMFMPSLLYGIFMGACYAGLLRLIKHREMAIAVVTMICWLSLYLFERSWAKTIGFAGTLILYVGAVTLLFDRLWYERFRQTLDPWTTGAAPDYESGSDPDASQSASA